MCGLANGNVPKIFSSPEKKIYHAAIYRENTCDMLIRESVDYVGMAPTRNIYNTQKPYNFTTNTLKACLSAQPSSLSAFVII